MTWSANNDIPCEKHCLGISFRCFGVHVNLPHAHAMAASPRTPESLFFSDFGPCEVVPDGRCGACMVVLSV